MGKGFQSGDKREEDEDNALVWRTSANDSFKYLATRETMGGWCERASVFLQAKYHIAWRAAKHCECRFFFGACILFEGPLSCEIDQNMDVSDLWMDL